MMKDFPILKEESSSVLGAKLPQIKRKFASLEILLLVLLNNAY